MYGAIHKPLEPPVDPGRFVRYDVMRRKNQPGADEPKKNQAQTLHSRPPEKLKMNDTTPFLALLSNVQKKTAKISQVRNAFTDPGLSSLLGRRPMEDGKCHRKRHRTALQSHKYDICAGFAQSSA